MTVLTNAQFIQKQIDVANAQQSLLDAQYAINSDRIAKQLAGLETQLAAAQGT